MSGEQSESCVKRKVRRARNLHLSENRKSERYRKGYVPKGSRKSKDSPDELAAHQPEGSADSVGEVLVSATGIESSPCLNESGIDIPSSQESYTVGAGLGSPEFSSSQDTSRSSDIERSSVLCCSFGTQTEHEANVTASTIIEDTHAHVLNAAVQTDNDEALLSKEVVDILHSADLTNFLNKLLQCKQLNMFKDLVRSISVGDLSTDNIAWKSALYRGKWQQCVNTTTMSYDAEYTEFFAVIKLLYGSSVCNVLRGPMHFGQVVNESTEKGKYSPNTAFCNFAIPSTRTLDKVSTGYPTNVPPGLIHHTMDVCQRQSTAGAQYILSFDGKMVSPGSRGDKDGDVDLWGTESKRGIATVHDALALRNRNLLSVTDLELTYDNVCLPVILIALKHMMFKLTLELAKIRDKSSGVNLLQNKILKMVAKNPDRSHSLRRWLSFVNVDAADCDNIIRRTMNLIADLCFQSACIHGTEGLVHTGAQVDVNYYSNCYMLKEPEDVQNVADLHLEENSVFIKPGSNLWTDKCKEGLAACSTLGKSIGLHGLAQQKEHYHCHILGKAQRQQNTNREQIRQHELSYDRHVKATLISTILPAMKPVCYKFYELGPVLVDSPKRNKVLCIAPNGMIDCRQGDAENTETISCLSHQRVMILGKFPWSQDSSMALPSYHILEEHVPQCLAQMAAFNSKELWLLTAVNKSITVIQVLHSSTLWDHILHIFDEEYGMQKLKMPTKLNTGLSRLKEKISTFVKTHTCLLLEVPLVEGMCGIVRETEYLSPYGMTPILDSTQLNIRQLVDNCKILGAECRLIFTETHRLLRQLAREMVLFMINHKDRFHSHEVPNCAPIGYGMKAKNMSCADLRDMLDILRDEMLNKGIPCLVEVYDGQWTNLVLYDKDNLPLTRLQMARVTWRKVSKMSKDRCVEEMLQATKMQQGDKDLISLTGRFPTGVTTFSNVQIKRLQTGALHITAIGSNLHSGSILGFISTCRDYSYFANPMDPGDNLSEQLPGNVAYTRKVVGLGTSEKSLVSILQDEELVEKLRLEMVSEGIALDTDNFNEEELPDLHDRPSLLERTLAHEDFHLLQDILNRLCDINQDKWQGKSADDIYPDILTDSKCLQAACNVQELKCIAEVLHVYTDRMWYSNKLKKSENANLIVSAFAGKQFCKSHTYATVRNDGMLSLYQRALRIVRQTGYPIMTVKISYAQAIHGLNRKLFDAKNLAPKFCFIPGAGEHFQGVWMQSYSRPEYSEKRHQVEFRTLDYTHMLTNMRKHILDHGYDYCPRNAFHQLCEDRPDILSRAAVHDILDKQNAFSAIRMFGLQVENYMRENEFYEAAHFIWLVRRWHDACDKRGRSADFRVGVLFDMYEFLTKDIDFDKFPFPYMGRYIRGMPVATYEAILQNICTRIQLYYFAYNGCYNARAVGTLTNESLFADLLRMSNSYLKAYKIPQVLGKVVTCNYYKHKPNKPYSLSATNRATYPVHLMEMGADKSVPRGNGYYVNHLFDYCDQHTSTQRVRKDEVSKGLHPLRCVPGVRIHYKTNEALILPEQRAGLNPKVDQQIAEAVNKGKV